MGISVEAALSVCVPVVLRLSIVKTRVGQEMEKQIISCSRPHKLLQRSEEH